MTALTCSRSRPSYHCMMSSRLAPASRFSKIAETGIRVPFNTQAPLTLPGMLSTTGHSDQSITAMVLPPFLLCLTAHQQGVRSAADPVSGELLKVHAQFVAFAVGEQLFPRHLAFLVTGHAAEHAAESGLDPSGYLVVALT